MKISARNILATYYQASENELAYGAEWYAKAHRHAVVFSQRYGVSTRQAAYVISMLSPSNRWDQNLRDAESMLQAHAAGLPLDLVTVHTYGSNRTKAAAYLQGLIADEDLWTRDSKKTEAFGLLIAGHTDEGHVCVDGHACAIAMGERVPLDSVPRIRGKLYDTIADAYREAAERAGVAPHVMQATTWLVWRRLHLAGTPWDRNDVDFS